MVNGHYTSFMVFKLCSGQIFYIIQKKGKYLKIVALWCMDNTFLAVNILQDFKFHTYLLTKTNNFALDKTFKKGF